MIARVHSSQLEQRCRLFVARVKWPVSTALLLVSFLCTVKLYIDISYIYIHHSSLAIGHSIIKSKHIIVSTWHEGYSVLARVDGRNTKKLLHKQGSPASRNQYELYFMLHDDVRKLVFDCFGLMCLQLCVLQRFQVPRHLSHSVLCLFDEAELKFDSLLGLLGKQGRQMLLHLMRTKQQRKLQTLTSLPEIAICATKKWVQAICKAGS